MRFQDDEHVNGELLAAAVSYANLAKQQAALRNEEELHEAAKRWQNSLYPPAMPTGGVDHGYPISGPVSDKPSTWPFEDKMWAPYTPKRNLVRAAALIVAELERMERHDKKVMEQYIKKRKRKRKHILDLATSDAMGLSWNDLYANTVIPTTTTPLTLGTQGATLQVNYAGTAGEDQASAQF